MPRLPDANDLGQTQYQPTRVVPNVPVADYAGSLNALGKGFAAMGQAAADYADKQQTRFRDEESYKTNLSLLKATDDFNTNTQGLDPSDPTYVEKRSSEWNKLFRPILEGVQDPKNRIKFGEWAAENGIKTHITSVNTAYDAKVHRTKLDVKVALETLQTQIADGKVSIEEGSRRARDIIATAPGLTVNQKRAIELEQGVNFDANATDIFGIQLIGNAKNAPAGWAPYEQNLGAFTKGMKDKGFDIVITSHFRTPEYQAKIRQDKFKELIAQGKSVAEAQNYVNEFFAQPSEDQPHATGASDLGVKLADGRVVRLGDPGSEAATKAAHDEAINYGLVFRLDGKDGRPKEDWHVEPLNKPKVYSDGKPVTVVDRENSKADMLAAFQSSAVYRSLPVDKRDAATRTFLQNYDLYASKAEEDRLLGETRTVIDSLVNEFPDPDERDKARTELRARVKDPALYEKGLILLDSAYDRKDATEKASIVSQYNEAFKTVSGLVAEGKPEDALAEINSYPDMPDDSRAKLIEYVRTKGGPKKDNAWIADELYAKAISNNPADRDAFAKVDLGQYVNSLSTETLNTLRTKQEAIQKGQTGSSIQTHSQLFESRMRELGIDMSANADQSTYAMRNRISTLVERNLEDAKRNKNGQPLTDAEAGAVIDRTFMQFRGTKKGYIWNSEVNMSLNDVIPRVTDYEKQKNALPGSTLNTIFNSFYAQQEQDRAEARRIISTSTDAAAVAKARTDLLDIDARRVDASWISSWLDRQTGTHTQIVEDPSLGN